MQTIVSMPGIHCASCAAMIKDISGEFHDIRNVDIDIAAKKVTIDHSDDFDFAQWKREIEALGETYKVEKAVSP